MGDVNLSLTTWRHVEVGRVVLLQGDSPYAGRLAVIVEIISEKRVLIDGPSSDPKLVVPRQAAPLSSCLLSQLSVEKLPRGARTGTVKKFWEKSEIDSKWKETNWFKKRTQIQRRKALTDFDRFKVMRLKKQRRNAEGVALSKIKASA